MCFLKNDVDRYNLVVDKMLSFHLTNKCEEMIFWWFLGPGDVEFRPNLADSSKESETLGTEFGGEWRGLTTSFKNKMETTNPNVHTFK